MDLDRVQVIYTELERYEIKLHNDPQSLGPKYLQDVIATCRNYLNLVSRVQLEVHREKQVLSRCIRAAEAAFAVAFDSLLATDERVKRLPSIEDRKATANVMLRAERQEVSRLKDDLADLDFVEKAVRHRHKELTSTMSEIKIQRSLIRDEIDSGAMYGDERHAPGGPSEGPLGQHSDLSEDEIEALLTTEEPAETTLPTMPAPAPQEAVVEPLPVTPEEGSDEALVHNFLATETTALSEPTSGDFSDEELDSLLDSV